MIERNYAIKTLNVLLVFISLVLAFIVLQINIRADALRVERDYIGNSIINTINPDGISPYETSFDSENKRIVVGDIEGGTFDIDPTAATYDITAPDGCWDFFIAKYDTDNSVEWAHTFENMGCSNEMSPIKPVIDSENNIYFIGPFAGTFDFDPGVTVENHTSLGWYSVFISKYSSDGTYQWTQSFGDQIADNQLKASLSGDKIIISSSNWSVNDLDPGPSIVSTTGNNFISAYSVFDGSYQFHKEFNTSYVWNNVSTTDAIYLTGDFSGTVDADPGAGTTNITSPGSSSAYLIKLNSQGDFQWAKVFGGSDAYDTGNLLSVSTNGNVYVGGSARSTDFDLDPNTGTDIFVGNGNRAAYLVKLSSNGDYYWGEAIGDDENVSSYQLEVDGYGNAYIRGQYTPPTDFDPTERTDIKSEVGVSNTYLLRLNNDGTYEDTMIWNATAWNFNWGFNIISTNTLKFTANTYCGVGSVTLDLNPLGEIDSVTTPVAGCSMMFYDLLQTEYYQIAAPAGKSVVSLENVDVTTSGIGSEAGSTKVVRVSDDTVVFADVTVGFNTDMDWTSVSMGSDSNSYKSFIHGIADVVPDALFTLYVPYTSSHNSVGICPGASSISEVNDSCAGLYTLDQNDTNVMISEINGSQYWAISGLSGTGGFGSAVLSDTDAPLNVTAPDTGIGEILQSPFVALTSLLLSIGSIAVIRKAQSLR